MIGLLLVAAGSFFTELSEAVGKVETKKRLESTYDLDLVNVGAVALIFVVTGIVTQNFVFQLASLPTFTLRFVFELAEIRVLSYAISRGDRSTVSFLRVLTIPVLALIDIGLGITFSPLKIAGMILIVLTVVALAGAHDLGKKAIGACVFIGINAALTISLYKYDITHFNSVEAEQGIMYSLLSLVALFEIREIAHERLGKLLSQPIVLAQMLAHGIGSALASYAYLFAPASVIIAAKRSATVIWSIVAGKLYFHEKHVAIKLAAAASLTGGLALLAF